MGKVSRKRRQRVIRQKNARRRKLQHLKEQYASAKKADQDKIEARVRKLAPYVAVDQYLKSTDAAQ